MSLTEPEWKRRRYFVPGEALVNLCVAVKRISEKVLLTAEVAGANPEGASANLVRALTLLNVEVGALEDLLNIIVEENGDRKWTSTI